MSAHRVERKWAALSQIDAIDPQLGMSHLRIAALKTMLICAGGE
jgi:hypothetical protein